MKQFKSRVKYFLCSLLFFLLFSLFAFYLYYFIKSPKPPDRDWLLEYYPKHLILKTGGSQFRDPAERVQHFLNFPLLKQKDVIRIGTFGDSFTFGEEVYKTETYPYQLQQLFDSHFPNRRVEILNFGKSGDGFPEQFFLWEEYAEKFSLDYILLGPQGFYPERDSTFRQNWTLAHLDYPKARFVLSENNNELEQIQIKGKTLAERYKNYYQFIPSWTALRYDRRPFQIHEKLFPSIRHNIPNPFYYKNTLSEEEESVRINTLLLKKIWQHHKQKILFFMDSRRRADLYQPKGALFNLNSLSLEHKSFYRVFDHKSSLGNELVAKSYFNALMGKKDFSLSIINCRFEDSDSISSELDMDFHDIKSIYVYGDNNLIAKLGSNTWWGKFNFYFDNEKEKIIKSLLGFSNESDFLESPYFPYSVQLEENMEVYIQLPDQSRFSLGSIKPLDSYKKFFVFYAKHIQFLNDFPYSYHRKVWFILNKMPPSIKKKVENEEQPLELFVGNHRVGLLQHHNLYGNKALKLIPVRGYEKAFLIKGADCCQVREKNFPSKFSLYVQYNMTEGKSIRSLIPDWKCKKKKKKIHISLPNFESLNL